MALAVGTRLGAYEIIDLLGAGGMGEVYRARDTKLGRDVAIKILLDAVANDLERIARFKREAKTLAALNHPNIAYIHGFEDSTGTSALVMELVEGLTLADRIAKGPLSIDEALPIATQIAEALEAAHEQGIIHRDLKPANIKIRHDGAVKILDFGLAKALEPAATGAGSATMSPTITTPAMMTGVGMILGTAAYMSPEQARGRAVDKRADIWAFGVVLFEMLTGTRPFDGDDVSVTLAAIIKTDPQLTLLPASLPAALPRLITRCLKKDPRDRLRDIGEARIVLHQIVKGDDNGPAMPTTTTRPWSAIAAWVVAAAGLITTAVVLVLWAPLPSRQAAVPASVRVTAEIGANASINTLFNVPLLGAAVVPSPDGTAIAFVAQTSAGAVPELYFRRLDQLQAAAVPGTAGASSPFFSPDGRWIAFFADGKLKKISTSGGAAVALCDAQGGRGGSWSPDGTIIFSPGNRSPLMRVSATGGKPEPVGALADDEASQRWPQVLPGGKAVLFTSHNGTTGFDEAKLVVQPLPNGTRKVVQPGGYFGTYVASGHLVYMHGGTLFAVPFDVARLETTGTPTSILEDVASNAAVAGSAQFGISANGVLVYLPGKNDVNRHPMVWLRRDGTTETLRSVPADWTNVHIAPDGRRVAMDIYDGRTDVWVYEEARDVLSRVTTGPGHSEHPVWTPDGRRIVFIRGEKPPLNLFWTRTDGTGEVQRLTTSAASNVAASWHPTGKFLAFWENSRETQDDLWILPMGGDEVTGWKPGTPTVFLRTPFAEREPMFSPDGRWIAYNSNETGRDEIYVSPFPGPGSKTRISTGGGVSPTWSRRENALLYLAPDQRLMVVTYAATGDSFLPEKPQAWSERRLVPRRRTGPTRSYDLHPDGNRVALALAPDAQTEVKNDRVVLMFNFFDELRRIAPDK